MRHVFIVIFNLVFLQFGCDNPEPTSCSQSSGALAATCAGSLASTTSSTTGTQTSSTSEIENASGDTHDDTPTEAIDELDDGVELADFPCEGVEAEGGFSMNDLRDLGRHQLIVMNREREFFAEESDNADPLYWSDALWKISVCHAKDMCDRNYFDHFTPEGASPADRVVDAVGSVYWSIAENLGYSGDSGGATFEENKSVIENQHRGYMNECVCNDGCATRFVSGHRKAILNNNLTHAGVAAWYCASNSSWYNAIVFWRTDRELAKENTFCAEDQTEDPPFPSSVLDQ